MYTNVYIAVNNIKCKKLDSLKSCVRTTDITFAAHCRNVNVFVSNISLIISAVLVLRVNDCRPYTPF